MKYVTTRNMPHGEISDGDQVVLWDENHAHAHVTTVVELARATSGTTTYDVLSPRTASFALTADDFAHHYTFLLDNSSSGITVTLPGAGHTVVDGSVISLIVTHDSAARPIVVVAPQGGENFNLLSTSAADVEATMASNHGFFVENSIHYSSALGWVASGTGFDSLS